MAIIVRQCYFCSQNIKNIDYKSVEIMERYISAHAKIIHPKHRGTCAKHQRKLAIAIKRARMLGLLPFVGR